MNFNELEVRKTKSRRVGGATRKADVWPSSVRFSVSKSGKKSFQFHEDADKQLGLNTGNGFFHFVNKTDGNLSAGVYIGVVPEDSKYTVFFTSPRGEQKSLKNIAAPILEEDLLSMNVISASTSTVEGKPDHQYIGLVAVTDYKSKIEGCPAEVTAVYQLVTVDNEIESDDVESPTANDDSNDNDEAQEEDLVVEGADEDDDEFSFD